MNTFKRGDHVIIGRYHWRKVHWTISSINENAHTANLVSGMTGRHLFDISLDALTLYKEGASA